MAARQSRNSYRYENNYYVYGNVVTKPEYQPRRQYEDPERRRKNSRQVRKNRRHAHRMSPGYVMFISIAAVIALIICINYVQLQSSITKSSKTITAMQKELSELREENNTRYNAIMDSVNLEEIRERADQLGMVYATADQMVEYESPSTDYVKQYEVIPESGTLAQSDKNE